MIIAGLDIETTGLEPGDHRIIEIYIGLWKPGVSDPLKELNVRINPERSIAVDAQRVHGISLSDLVSCPIWSTVAPNVQKYLDRADLWVAHNGDGFDLPFIGHELKRENLDMPKRPSVDTMLQGIWATPDGKKPNLAELCFACGVEYDPAKAHAADYDVKVMMQCYFRGLGWGFFQEKEAA